MVVAVLLAVITAIVAALYHYIDSVELPPDMFDDIYSHSQEMGYTVAAFNVTTEDGYVLSLFRLADKRVTPQKPILFVHGVGVNGDQFTVNYHTKPMAYRMVDEGYDVWIANTRGSLYSDRHLTLTPEDPEFWDWTAEEIIQYDLPSFIDTVLAHSSYPRLSIIGHSQGAMVSLGVLATKPKYCAKVAVLLAIACPSAKNSNESWIFKLFTHRYILSAFEFLGKDHFFRRGKSMWFQKLISRFQGLGYYYIRSRYDTELNNDVYGKFEVYSYRFAGGTSLKNLRYYSQNIYSTDPRPHLFDYGLSTNLLMYGQPTPPQIDFSVISSNLAFFGGEYDQVVKPCDLQALIEVLPKEKVVFKKLDYHHDHGSFALSRNQEFVLDMLAVLQRYT